MNRSAFAFALGTGTRSRAGEWLEIFYPAPLLHPDKALYSVLESMPALRESAPDAVCSAAEMNTLGQALRAAGMAQQADLAAMLADSAHPVAAVLLTEDRALRSVPEAYLKLHLLSHRLVQPNSISLENLFAVLPTVAWTSCGAVEPTALAACQLQARLEGKEPLRVYAVDKFPSMTDYVVPSGVRIADSARVRLGAWLGEGTTVMPEGFINFNAGTAGPNMVEGRISAGVVVAAGSDLGGGSSTMGTLSGGNEILISVGRDCLIGANAGTGIPLGDRCTIEAGLYLTAGSVVTPIDSKGAAGARCKAQQLAGKSDLLFRRNSASGTIECLPNPRAATLNAALHGNN